MMLRKIAWVGTAQKSSMPSQRVLEVCHPDLPDYWKGLARVRADRYVQVGHGYASLRELQLSRGIVRMGH